MTGGKRSALGGTFFEPTVATDVVVTREESFGSVTPLYRFKTDEEAANDTPTLTLPRSRGREGRRLAAYFYSRDIGRICRVAEALEYGIVGINEGIISTEIAPFGGMKETGIEEFLEVKYRCMKPRHRAYRGSDRTRRHWHHRVHCLAETLARPHPFAGARVWTRDRACRSQGRPAPRHAHG